MKRLALVIAIHTPALAAADKTFNDNAGGSWDCSKDGVVSINSNHVTITLTGACKTVSLNGNNDTVTIAGASTLLINGNDDAVTVATVATVSVNGNRNKLTYGKTAKPTLSNLGKDNKIDQAK